MKATTTAGSAPAMARNTTAPAASGRAPPRKTCTCRLINSSPTARFRSAETSYSGFYNERKFDLPADQSRDAMVREAAADRRADPFLVRCLSDAAQSELLVDLQRHSLVYARRADHHRHRAGNALP